MLAEAADRWAAGEQRHLRKPRAYTPLKGSSAAPAACAAACACVRVCWGPPLLPLLVLPLLVRPLLLPLPLLKSA
jgi:hypothetical protein